MSVGRGHSAAWRALLTTAALAAALGACDEDDTSSEFAPADCQREPPELGLVIVKVTIDGEHSKVPLQIFEGNFEDEDVVVTDTLSTERGEYELPPDRYYAVAAEYQDGGETVYAIDGGDLSLSSTDYADARCWEVDNLTLDATLDAGAR